MLIFILCAEFSHTSRFTLRLNQNIHSMSRDIIALISDPLFRRKLCQMIGLSEEVALSVLAGIPRLSLIRNFGDSEDIYSFRGIEYLTRLHELGYQELGVKTLKLWNNFRLKSIELSHCIINTLRLGLLSNLSFRNCIYYNLQYQTPDRFYAEEFFTPTLLPHPILRTVRRRNNHHS